MTVIIDLFAKLMVCHCKTLFNLAIVQAILMWISVEWVPALHRVASRDLKQVTFSNFWPFMLIPALMLFVLLIMILIFFVCADYHSTCRRCVYVSVVEVLKFTIAVAHKISIVGASQVAYGPATNRDGYVMVMKPFLHDLH